VVPVRSRANGTADDAAAPSAGPLGSGPDLATEGTGPIGQDRDHLVPAPRGPRPEDLAPNAG
jgi:hypothetical protein